MEWVMQNEAAARQISFAATQWIHDLMFHPQAKSDEKIIIDEMLRRYLLHWT
jgi:hypothetical protein